MSGFHIPKWLDIILAAGDKVHKAVHPSRWGEDKPCECGLLTRGDCGRKFGPGCVAPTHRCTICGALWRWMPESFGGAWNLRSVKAGPCCDNAAMEVSGFGKDLDGFELSTETLIFFPASEIPSGDGRGHYLMYNPCDGWHIVELRDGEFYSWANSSPWPRNSIHCWAKLPEVLS